MKTVGTSVKAWDLRPGDLFFRTPPWAPTLDRNSFRCLIGIAQISKRSCNFCKIIFISHGHVWNMIVSKDASYVKVR